MCNAFECETAYYGLIWFAIVRMDMPGIGTRPTQTITSNVSGRGGLFQNNWRKIHVRLLWYQFRRAVWTTGVPGILVKK